MKSEKNCKKIIDNVKKSSYTKNRLRIIILFIHSKNLKSKTNPKKQKTKNNKGRRNDKKIK